MATVWAKNSGNWVTASLWAYYNENSQQIEDYNQSPQIDDIVYCNGYQINTPSNTSLSVKEIRNDTNPYTSLSGGLIIDYSGNITAEKFISVGHLFQGAGVFHNIFNGDFFSYDNGPLYRRSGGSLNYQINGNVNIYNSGTLISTDSVSAESAYVIINGNLYNESSRNIFSLHDATINGSIILNNAILRGSSITINGFLSFSSTSIIIPLQFDNITILNDDSFIITDNSNPRVNPFIFVTDAELNNRQQYPQESDVKKGVEYAYGLKEGNYLPNFPQEANVLKDVEYGDNQKGTLEVIALSGATATAENISVVNLTEQEVNRVKNCATVSTVQKCFEDFKEE